MTVRLHTGDPAIYGAIQEQMDELSRRNIEYTVIPGVSSFLATAAALKQEYTLPEISQTVIITRNEGRTPVPEKEKLKSLAAHQATMCIFLSVHMISEVVEQLIEGAMNHLHLLLSCRKLLGLNKKLYVVHLKLLPISLKKTIFRVQL